MNEPKTEPQIRLTGGFWQKKQELNRNHMGRLSPLSGVRQV